MKFQKFPIVMIGALFLFAGLASADAKAECKINSKSLKSALAVATKSATTDLFVCAVSNTKPVGNGYVETDVQYAPAGESFCMKEDEVFTATVTVKWVCK